MDMEEEEAFPNRIDASVEAATHDVEALLRLLRSAGDPSIFCQSTEFRSFVEAARLLKARHDIFQNGNASSSVVPMQQQRREPTAAADDDHHDKTDASHFQSVVQIDEIILTIFRFLECKSLVQAASTCKQFHRLAHRSGVQRTRRFYATHRFSHVMLALRSCEIVEGTASSTLEGLPVAIPLLGLPRPVIVSNCGDPNFNGIYYCTEAGGNGFIFTKPIARDIPFRVRQSSNDIDMIRGRDSVPLYSAQGLLKGRRLRCVITKRFSNETILWYMSREIGLAGDGRTIHRFSFWARLLVTNDVAGNRELCQYPSQSSILTRNGDPGWQALAHVMPVRPPTVEVLMDTSIRAQERRATPPSPGVPDQRMDEEAPTHQVRPDNPNGNERIDLN